MGEPSRCRICGLPDGPDYGDPHECPPGFVVTLPAFNPRRVPLPRSGVTVLWIEIAGEVWVAPLGSPEPPDPVWVRLSEVNAWFDRRTPREDPPS